MTRSTRRWRNSDGPDPAAVRGPPPDDAAATRDGCHGWAPSLWPVAPSPSRCPARPAAASPPWPAASAPSAGSSRSSGSHRATRSPPGLIPELERVISPVAGSQVAGKRSGYMSPGNSGGGCSPSGTNVARSTKAFGLRASLLGVTDNASFQVSCFVLIDPDEIRAKCFSRARSLPDTSPTRGDRAGALTGHGGPGFAAIQRRFDRPIR